MSARRVDLSGFELCCCLRAIGPGGGGVERDEWLVFLYMLAIANVDGAQHAAVRCLPQLVAPGSDPLARRGRDDLALGEDRPAEAQRGAYDTHPPAHSPQWLGGGFHHPHSG